jgi:prephenate dehydrogenase
MTQNTLNISIIGLGLIGGSIAKALKNSNHSFFISAYDKNEVLDKAQNEKVIDLKLKNPEEAIDSDIIFLCLPLEANLNVFKILAPKLNKESILTDVSGIKLAFKNEWDQIDSAGTYVGGHPMTGKENGGYDNSDPLLFENSVYIVSEDLTQNEFLVDFKNIIELMGANILCIPAKQHDVIAASVSHLPQLLAITLVNTASLKTDEYNFLDLAAGGFRDLTRIASSDYRIWDEVIRQNKKQIIAAIEEFSYELDNVKKSIALDNSSELLSLFENARKSRDEIPKNSKGFLTPVHDVFIFVKDEPGVISKISTKLFESNINIKDIELLKIREGNGGTFRLSFATKKIAESAKLILSDLGFKFRD